MATELPEANMTGLVENDVVQPSTPPSTIEQPSDELDSAPASKPAKVGVGPSLSADRVDETPPTLDTSGDLTQESTQSQATNQPDSTSMENVTLGGESETETNTLTLLGESVEPGTSAILTWEMEASFQDVSVPVPVLAVNGVNSGPTLCITAALHGDELNGIEIVRQVVHELDPKTISGAVIGVPIVNLEGFKRATRYLPDRRDLNRYFPGHAMGSYASRIANSFFTNVIAHCDYLIDLHTGSLSRTNLPQIRADLSNQPIADLAQRMGSIVVLQSQGGLGTLRRAAADAGIPAVTLEAGGPNNLQKEAVEQGIKAVNNTLMALGVTSQPRWKRNAEPTFYRSKWVRAREGGILFSQIELGDNVRKGQVLGLISNPVTNRTTKIKAPFAGRVIGMALNQLMYPGFAAYHIGLKSSIVEMAEPADQEDDDYYDFGLNESIGAGVDEEEYESDANDLDRPANSDNPDMDELISIDEAADIDKND